MDDLRRRSGWIVLVFLVWNEANLADCRPVDRWRDNLFAAEEIDTKWMHNLVLGLLVTVATLISLMIVLVLCTCGSKPERKSQTESATDNGDVAVAGDGVPTSPSPDALTDPVPDPALAVPTNNAPKLRTASASSNNPGHADDPLIRCSTIERRLPELPPTPMPPVLPTAEDEEDDYNRTYDVIGETKTGAGAVKDDSKKDSFPEGEVEDEQYASVSDGAAGKRARVRTEPTADTDYNTISVGTVDAGNTEEGDESYAVVVVPGADAKGAENAPYASVGVDKDEKEGYSRLRSVQKRTREESAEGGEKNGYARLRDITMDSATVGGAGGGAMGGATEDDEEVPPVPYKPPDLQNEDEEANSPIPRSPSAGTAGSATANGATDNVDGNAPATTKKREPPYTQVSARESLEVVRARQQAEQSARQAAHYQTIEEDQNLDADHDGIYEPVDDQQLDGQMLMSPPPLPGDRQGPSNGPSASNNWQLTRAPRVYEEITDETRPRPPNTLVAAANAQAENDDDIEPYAVAEKRPSPADVPTYTVVDKKSKARYAKVHKVTKHPDQANNNARTEARAADPGSPSSPAPTDAAGMPLYAVVEKKGKSTRKESESAVEFTQDSPPATETAQDDAYQALEDNYQTVGDVPGSNGDPSSVAAAGGMVHVDERELRSELWTKKEHMYIDVETNQPSTPPASQGNSSTGLRTNHSYEAVEVVATTASKKERHKQAKKEAKREKKEAKREKKHSKSSKGGKEKDRAKGSAGEDTVWQRQEESPEANGNSNNNTDPFDGYENMAFPLQETRL